MNEKEFQSRINYQGELTNLLAQVSQDFDLGKYLSHTINEIGYEDLNIALITKQGKYFVKIFSSIRKLDDCYRFINIVNTVIKAGVSHPKLFKANGDYLYEYGHGNSKTYLCVMEFVDGDSFYGLKREPTQKEMLAITDIAVQINSIDYRPPYIYDSWAVPNIEKEYLVAKPYLKAEDDQELVPLIEEVKKIDFNTLPHAFVHGDLIKTNVLLNKDNQLFVIDFSVSNYYPRIQELAILLVNMFFSEKDLSSYGDIYDLILTRYQKTLLLEKQEIELLPLYIKFAHAMHIIGATREKGLNGDNSAENSYWLNLGRTGLSYMKTFRN